jgi:hypothetical protein
MRSRDRAYPRSRSWLSPGPSPRQWSGPGSGAGPSGSVPFRGLAIAQDAGIETKIHQEIQMFCRVRRSRNARSTCRASRRSSPSLAEDAPGGRRAGARGGVLALGWPPRIAFFSYMVWLVALACQALRLHGPEVVAEGAREPFGDRPWRPCSRSASSSSQSESAASPSSPTSWSDLHTSTESSGTSGSTALRSSATTPRPGERPSMWRFRSSASRCYSRPTSRPG